MVYFFDKNEKISKAEALGVTGDFLGGVINPILSFFSFIAILYTISLQSKELQATRSELSRTAAAQEKSVYLLNGLCCTIRALNCGSLIE